MADGKHGVSQRRWLPWAVLGGVLAGAGIIAGIIAGTTNTSSAASSSGLSACAVTPVADQVLPSVVTIYVTGSGGSGTGSGEVIKSGGYILTNNHVIAAAASGGSIQVQFADGQTASATIVGRDPQTDIAVIKADTNQNLQVLPMGSSSSLQVGQPVVVIGAPLGLSGTVTNGIVSALDRTVEVPGENNSSALLVDAIQTDAAINPGNSGGAMVNCEGQLVGVPSAGATVPAGPGQQSSGGSIGLGFAIPVDLAQTISNEIIATGTVTHAYFGLSALPIPPAAAAAAGVPEGLYVKAVVPGGPAAQAGLRAGDVITTINGEPATDTTQLQQLTLTKKPGDTVQLGYSSNGKQATATVTLGTQP
jgi:putative serine protease PepD